MHTNLPTPPRRAATSPTSKTATTTTARVATSWHERDEWSKKRGLHATVHFVGGDHYTGEWFNNLRHGRGTHVGKNHAFVYEGQWEADKRCGYGTLSVPVTNKDKKQDNKNKASETVKQAIKGPPTHTFTAAGAKGTPVVLSKVYAGDWHADVRSGVGTAYYADGARYEGQWKDNVRCGWGTMFYADGSRYDGEWRADMRHGQGILLLANMDRYEGIFVNDMKEGPGKFFFKHRRQVYEGEWSADMPKCGVIHDLETRAFHIGASGLVTSTITKSKLPVLELADPAAVLAQRRQEIQEERVQRLLNPGAGADAAAPNTPGV
ncbi:hypothetical protein BCR44DRAFT_402072 [Catenaria anguillulae PL171]|uniref:MORN repeat-containing protein 3 n=1 Tax=Catenaria anguillulae PL171 TaxID=765915 RepID=A0A1Y2HNY1_9FUNG|nr:hypothetical protein BCR44DRAFT_402072 [Catenaria anguillulae PL171]